MSLTYEALVPKLKRLYLTKNPEQLQPHMRAAVERISTRRPVPGVRRLPAERGRARLPGGRRSIAECADLQVSDLAPFIRGLDSPEHRPMLDDLADRLDAPGAHRARVPVARAASPPACPAGSRSGSRWSGTWAPR